MLRHSLKAIFSDFGQLLNPKGTEQVTLKKLLKTQYICLILEAFILITTNSYNQLSGNLPTTSNRSSRQLQRKYWLQAMKRVWGWGQRAAYKSWTLREPVLPTQPGKKPRCQKGREQQPFCFSLDLNLVIRKDRTSLVCLKKSIVSVDTCFLLPIMNCCINTFW